MHGGPKTVLITGASSGIGHACALRMSDAGWKVFATVRKTADGEKLRATIPNLVPGDDGCRGPQFDRGG